MANAPRLLGRTLRGLLVAFILLLGAATGRAQETTQIGRLTITGSNADSFPSVQLQAYGMDGQGNPIDFTTEPLFLNHNGFPVDEVIFDGRVTVGTLTVFLIDVTGGVADQLPAIEALVRQYASAGNMQEQVDYVAVYQNRADGPQQLLEPTQFYNSVNNLFATTPLAAEQGATSLYDAVIRMVDETTALKPDPAMAASIILISDGTDPGTSQAQPGDVPTRAAAAGIPVHTVVLTNPELGGQTFGPEYMRQVAAGSRGIATELGNAEGIAAIWARIGAFREQSLVRYTVPEPASGTFPVELSLLNNRDTKATTEVTVSGAVPNVVINLARESRSLTVPNLDEPIELQLSATVSWLDGQAREVTAAQLLVNDTQVAEIPPADLASFTAPVSNFIFGDNRLEVAVTDSQGLTSVSAPVIITVTQGDEVQVPEELQPAGFRFNPLWLLGLLAVLALGVLGYFLWRSLQGRPAGTPRRRRRGGPPADYPPTPTPAQGVDVMGEVDFMKTGLHEKPFVMAHLDVLEAQTIMADELTLRDPEVRIGRSPALSQIAFRDDLTVSRAHAVLRLEGNRYRIYDAGSTSGTYVNDRQVPEYGLQLADGDVIQLGAVRLRYRQL